MKPVKVYQDCAVCDIGRPAKVFFAGTWWTTTPVIERRDTPEGLPRFETWNTIYQPDTHDGGDTLNKDYAIEKPNLRNPFGSRRLRSHDADIFIDGEEI